MRLRVALVGCGVMAGMVAEGAYPAVDELAQVVATVDIRPERAEALAALLGARPYHTLADALAAEDVDAVDVRLPHPQHAGAVLQAVRAGKHVLVEKPLATTVADGVAMVREADRAGVKLAVAENYRFFGAVAAARRAIDEGAIGRLLVLRTQRVLEIGGIWGRDGWRFDASRAGGGVLMDQGCHQVNLMRALAGEITHVHAYAGDRREGWSGEDSAVVNCRFAGGLIGSQLYCWGTPTPAAGAEAYAYGTEGSIELHVTYGGGGQGGVLLQRPGPAGGTWYHQGGDYGATAVPTLSDFLEAVAEDREPAMPGRDGLVDLAVVAAAYRSTETGREEAVELE